jgi:DNA-directed RNA polymerase subunit F
MALKAVLDTIDDLSDDLKSHYQQSEDGKFMLSVEPVGGFALEDVTGLKTALGQERTTRQNLEKQVVKFKDIDPDKAREALEKLEELAEIDPAKEADKIANTKFEAAKAQLLEKHTSEITTRDERINGLTGTIDKLLREQRATMALAEAKGAVDLLLPHVLASTRTVEKEPGRFEVEVIDKDGNVRIDGKGNNMDIKGLVAEMRQSEAFGRAFDGTGHSGSGKQPGGGTGGSGTLKRSKMTTAQKAEYVREHGQEAFLKLPS